MSSQDTVGLTVQAAAPGVAVLTAPANGALNVPATPTFTWNAVAGASSYSIQVATDAGFANVVASATGLASPTWTSNVTLNTNTLYYWRVQATNACGTGTYSSVFSFRTVAAPGDCAAGTTPNILYQYGFESGASGWTSSGTGNTWAIATTNPHSGASHYHANDPATVSDQRLISPAGHAAHRPEPGDPQVLARAEPGEQRRDRLLRRRHPGSLDRRRHDVDPGTRRQSVGWPLHGRGFQHLR